ncbi:Alpha/beta hydrolase family-domain-containing protein [Nemania sp. FL0031]|nr:Alpha/beta hydrolase family-domain-containing protein [Nemania sp. FL0031]
MSSFPFHIKEHVVPCQHIREWARATANSQEDVLHLHVKQYIPKDNPSPQPGDVTILGAHANGFPKELYEALWQDLHAKSKSPSQDNSGGSGGGLGVGVGGEGEGKGFRIRSIWIADISNQGYSGELNEAKLGNDPFWHDLARDLLHLTNVFRAEMPRPLVGLGHSFGANILTQLSLLHPRLLTTLVLLDPTIVVFDPARHSGPGVSPAQASTFRREVWPSRQDAVESFKRSPFYQSWDPRVLDAWNKHALRDLPTLLFPEPPTSTSPSTIPGVTLRTTKHQEVLTFFRPLYPYIITHPPTASSPETTYSVSRSGAPDYDPSFSSQPLGPGAFDFYRSEGHNVLKYLPHVRPSVLFVHGATSDLSLPHLRAGRVSTCGTGPGGSGGAAAGRVSEVVVEGRGHLFPMEVPAETAAYAARWIGGEMARWRDEQREYEAWTRLPMREKMTMSQEFVDKVGRGKPRRNKADKSKL